MVKRSEKSRKCRTWSLLVPGKASQRVLANNCNRDRRRIHMHRTTEAKVELTWGRLVTIDSVNLLLRICRDSCSSFEIAGKPVLGPAEATPANADGEPAPDQKPTRKRRCLCVKTGEGDIF